MSLDQFYPEPNFVDSFTFGKWVPLFCADIASLCSFRQVYNRSANPSVCIFPSYTQRNKALCTHKHGSSLVSSEVKPGNDDIKGQEPFFFRNHPINYVSLTGKILDIDEKPVGQNTKGVGNKEKQSRLAVGNSSIIIFQLDDNSGKAINCMMYSDAGTYNIWNMKGRVFEVQGYVTEHILFGRQVRVTYFRKKKRIEQEISSWKEVLDVKRNVLCKHWDHSVIQGQEEDLTLSKIAEGSEPQDAYNREEVEKNGKAEIEIDSKSLTKLPTLYCSFLRQESLLVQAPSSMVHNDMGGIRLSDKFRKSTLVSKDVVKIVVNPSFVLQSTSRTQSQLTAPGQSRLSQLRTRYLTSPSQNLLLDTQVTSADSIRNIVSNKSFTLQTSVCIKSIKRIPGTSLLKSSISSSIKTPSPISPTVHTSYLKASALSTNDQLDALVRKKLKNISRSIKLDTNTTDIDTLFKKSTAKVLNKTKQVYDTIGSVPKHSKCDSVSVKFNGSNNSTASDNTESVHSFTIEPSVFQSPIFFKKQRLTSPQSVKGVTNLVPEEIRHLQTVPERGTYGFEWDAYMDQDAKNRTGDTDLQCTTYQEFTMPMKRELKSPQRAKKVRSLEQDEVSTIQQVAACFSKKLGETIDLEKKEKDIYNMPKNSASDTFIDNVDTHSTNIPNVGHGGIGLKRRCAPTSIACKANTPKDTSPCSYSAMETRDVHFNCNKVYLSSNVFVELPPVTRARHAQCHYQKQELRKLETYESKTMLSINHQKQKKGHNYVQKENEEHMPSHHKLLKKKQRTLCVRKDPQ